VKWCAWSRPGTVVEPGLLPGDANNYLAAIVMDESKAGLAYVDITTGEFATTALSLETLRAELTRLHPAKSCTRRPSPLSPGEGWGERLPGHSTPWPAWRFEPGRCEEALLRHFQASTLDGFGLKHLGPGGTRSRRHHPIPEGNPAGCAQTADQLADLQPV
jgi:DNA mismatch repair protein MutS